MKLDMHVSFEMGDTEDERIMRQVARELTEHMKTFRTRACALRLLRIEIPKPRWYEHPFDRGHDLNAGEAVAVSMVGNPAAAFVGPHEIYVNGRRAELPGMPVVEMDPPEFHRASGDAVCDQCLKKYYEHPFAPEHRGSHGPYLRRLCGGALVKL